VLVGLRCGEAPCGGGGVGGLVGERDECGMSYNNFKGIRYGDGQ